MKRKRRILLLSLGGTIACRPTKSGLVPKLTASDLLEEVTVPEFTCTTGEDLIRRTVVFPEDWVLLSESVAERFDSYDGFVLTLGTDTLAHVAAALSLMLQNLTKPVVLTGSMRPIDAPDTDARGNLSDAIRVASSGVGGVFVVFCGKIIHGARASKVDTVSLEAFASINGPVAGRVVRERLVWISKPTKVRGALRVASRIDPRVTCVKLMPQMVPADFRFSKRYAGILVEGYGDGNVPNNLVPALAALAREKVVVLASQCTHGEVAHRYEGGKALIRAGALSAGDMTKEYAAAKLMWVLGQTRSRAAARRLFVSGSIPNQGRLR